jgi:RIO-like serine/threonine protein kinase
MALIDQVIAQLDKADVVVVMLVEGIRGREHEASALAVASQIRGAPPREVERRLSHLAHLGLLEPAANSSYAVTLMGAELLYRGVEGWKPSAREQAHRDALALSATAGAVAPRRS